MKPYDSGCYELAAKFLADPVRTTDGIELKLTPEEVAIHANMMAHLIQQFIEGQLHESADIVERQRVAASAECPACHHTLGRHLQSCPRAPWR